MALCRFMDAGILVHTVQDYDEDSKVSLLEQGYLEVDDADRKLYESLQYLYDAETQKPKARPAIELTPAMLVAKAKRDRAKAVAAITVEVDGMVFDGDEKAQERMARAVTLADTPDETTYWVLHDNTVAQVTADQLRRACKLAGQAQTALWTVPYTS